MARLGILGGTFNPVHNGHIAVAQAALEEYALDRIMFLPNYQPPHKECAQTPGLRLEMTKAAVSDNPDFFVSDFEINKGGISYSVNTLKAFKELYPENELYFIIGGDSLRDFKKWYKPEEIVKNCILLVYPRDDINLRQCIGELKDTMGASVYELHAPVVDISSTQIRELIKEGKSAKGLVPHKVLEFIEKNNLYRG